MVNKLNIKKGDNVLVISGKDKGRRGKVQKVLPQVQGVVVEGINLAKKHAKPTKANPQGGVIDKSLPLKVSKVKVICSECDQPIRIRKDRAVDGASVRVCSNCGRTMD